MQQEARTFEALGVRIAVVTFERAAMARAYAHETGLPWPILVDESRALYGAYGMYRGARWDIWGPSSWWAYAKELMRGRTPRRPNPGSDISQLGGDVLIDPAGIVRLAFVGRGPADRPSIAALLAAREP